MCVVILVQEIYWYNEIIADIAESHTYVGYNYTSTEDTSLFYFISFFFYSKISTFSARQ